MIRQEASEGATEESGRDLSAESYLQRSQSMIEQINEVLRQKLAERESGPRAVRLAEGLGGGIRVYVGVESYSIDEVPDEEVRAIIRQAVKEWEAQR